jgi:prolyl-tRNA editing enzyme YbaK/EbsC (Cys-tRNA(Pro) deacylase)
MSVTPWPEPVERVATYLRAAGAEARLEELRSEGATAQDAADAIGCTLGQIVKSIVLMCDGEPVVALLPGDRRADTRRIARTVGARHARIARADEVLSATGFEPGSVAPFPLAHVQRVLIDRVLLEQRTVWCGAGSPRHLAAMTPLELQRLTRAETTDVASRERLGEAETESVP